MKVKDRVKELRRVRASELRPSKLNWRSHPKNQQDALRGILADVGFAGVVLARELEDGSLELVDGHLRAETLPDQAIPVAVLDVTEDEAKLLLASYDPISALATADAGRLDALLKEVNPGSEALAAMLADLARDAGIGIAEEPEPEQAGADDQSGDLAASFVVVVECDGEGQQTELLERLTAEGYRCRSLIS